jgi:hypothetical protein
MARRRRWVPVWVCLLGATALTGCARPPEIKVGTSPGAPPSPSPPPAPAASSPSPAPPTAEPSLDYSSYYACSATVKKPSLPAGERQTVRVRSTLPSARVTVTATYGRVKQPLSGTTDARGEVDIVFKTLPTIRAGTPVEVAVDVVPSTHCSTSFTVG